MLLFLSLSHTHTHMQESKSISNNISFLASLSLSLTDTHTHTHTLKSKSLFPITMAKYGGVRGDIGGLGQGFGSRCPRGTANVEEVDMGNVRGRSESRLFK